MIIIGIDLAGITNPKETVAAIFKEQDKQLTCISVTDHLSDQDIYGMIQHFEKEEELVIAIDAPLSYNFGGGDRPSDVSLRKAITSIGMKSSSVMTPTAPRINYLTMRGITLSRGIASLKASLQMVEVHPGATIGLHTGITPVPTYILDYKDGANMNDRKTIIHWMENTMQMHNINNILKANGSTYSSHEVDACAAALAGWKWKNSSQCWLFRATGIDHPYDFSC